MCISVRLLAHLSRGRAALFLLWFLGAEQVHLVAAERAQFQCVFHAHVQLFILPVLHIQNLHLVHVHPALVVQDVPPQQILRQTQSAG